MLPAYADNMLVSGSTSGQFSNPTGGSTVSGNKWFYDDTADFVSFDGVSLFSGLTPSPFEFGRITLTNLLNGPDAKFEAGLNLVIDFTLPSGQSLNFNDGLRITAKSEKEKDKDKGKSSHGDRIDLAFHDLPEPKSFTVGNEVYTVSFDGFYDSATKNSSPVTSLFVSNDPGGSASAYLWGSISSEQLHTESLRAPISAVPEPGSILLLATIAGGAIASIRRKRRA